ncbi:ATP-dependent DNA helicase, RecQ family [Xylanimonas cellulosilytica DSM 15894]|uniref:DNA 3'-5' helicase n=1 Tax=Xylanimonas cellulosilytica (strain DSM 15894 / JCM 12276 / CECT 5975 / KCTC 9989 / LMG 20990 / NBRC 107835 / XIL07) TaxID=446471 RepID=D1BR81_XYLCX|nr:RecQ family ATP-dependent DNA helicase [Xylanimonas cellulosilytica]ACZ30336.1 ATP-dependent DNA helicase, RecQ family [Xylanimonas cellulosilytica DSM 15894]
MLRGLIDTVGPDGEATGSTLRGEAEAALRSLVGRDDAVLREDQWRAIEALAAFRRRALVVQRTGWGKSAVYFVATSLLRARGAGPTVIISPLLALMRDQIAAAARAGIRAVTINSANVTEWESVHAQIAAGEVDVLLCSPERLNNPGFRDEVLPRLAADAGLVVVDEAHCISDWGHDFRPDYRRIRTLLADLPPGIPVLATTATANERVTRDVAEQLAVHASGLPDTDVLVLRGPLDRESLHLAVLELPDQPTRVAWLAEALQDIEGSGIVYCLTVSAAEQVAEQLRAAGLAVAAYTGRTDPTQREALEADLKENRVKALVATSALGMGFDKPDLGFVVHLGAPSSPIAYYQQVGRAGRGVDSAVVVLLPGQEDRAIWDWFGAQAFPAEGQVRATLAALEAADGPLSTPALEPLVDLKRSRLETMLKVLDVDGAVRRVQGGWTATGRPWAYDAERYARVAATREAEQQAMVEYVRTSGCRMAFLRRQLDDPELAGGGAESAAWRCGRCDRCGGVALPDAPDAEAVAAARHEMDRPGVEVEPRKLWPSGLAALGLDLRGRLAAGELAEPGRAIARLDGLGWSGPLRDLLAPGAPDGELPVPLRRAAARVLDDWAALRASSGDDADSGPSEDAAGFSPEGEAADVADARPPLRIEAVVAVRSVTRPQLTFHLADGLARYLGVPMIGAVGPAAGHETPGRHDLNSAMRLAGVAQRLELQLSEPALHGLPGRSVLLVDDWTESGWTLTVAARLLRQAGAARVFPFVLGIR